MSTVSWWCRTGNAGATLLLSLGLFGLLINAGLLWLTDKLIDDFEIPSLGMTVLMALLLTVGKFVLRLLL